MNQIILMGRLTRDPEIRYSQGANPTAIARFSLAADRRYKRENGPTADFFNCTAFGKQAEFVERYLKQGTKILLSGRMENNDYTNRDGVKIHSYQVVTESIEFAESKRATEEAQEERRRREQPDADGFYPVPDALDDDDLPFN